MTVVGMPEADFKGASPNAHFLIGEMPAPQQLKGSWWEGTGASFIIMHKNQADPAKGKEVLKFFEWAYKDGGAMAADLDYVAMPPAVIKQVAELWKADVKDGSGKAVW